MSASLQVVQVRQVPDEDQAMPDQPGPADAGPPAAANPAVTKTRILVADDDPDLRQLLQIMLQWDGYEVIEAMDGVQVMNLAIDSAPSLIVLDVMMPGADGFSTLRQLRSDGRTQAVPVIVISGRGDQQSRTEGLTLGADAYLEKPISLRSLMRCVRTAIQRRAMNPLFNPAVSKA